MDSTLVATGPRRFEHRALRGWRISDPEPTLEVPVRYEHAYGGWCDQPPKGTEEPRAFVYRTNPSGKGVFDEAALDKRASYEGPQWELPSSPITSINVDSPLAGFGPVARMWSARVAYGGTCDEAWEAQMREDVARGLPPDYPADFDLRFFQCAHPSLIAPDQLRGGDVVILRGLEESGELAFELPGARPFCEVLAPSDTWLPEPVSLDLVHIDLDTRRVTLTWRVSLAAERDIAAVFFTTEQE